MNRPTHVRRTPPLQPSCIGLGPWIFLVEDMMLGIFVRGVTAAYHSQKGTLLPTWLLSHAKFCSEYLVGPITKDSPLRRLPWESPHYHDPIISYRPKSIIPAYPYLSILTCLLPAVPAHPLPRNVPEPSKGTLPPSAAARSFVRSFVSSRAVRTF